MSERFDWNTDDTVIIRPQPAIAVQGDEHGNLLIRQEGQYGISDDQYIDVRRENVLTFCRAVLREAGLHQSMIVQVDEISFTGTEGQALRIPAEALKKLDRIAEEGRLEDIAERVKWEPPIPSTRREQGARDPKAAERKRRQRQKEREAKTVTTSRPVTPVTPRDSVTVTRDTVTTAPRLPVELDLLQHHGGAKQPVG
jgi:hypothetical protein